MARIWTSGFELNSVSTGVEFDNMSASVTIVSAPVRSGTYAARVNPAATTAQIRKNLFAGDQSSIGYLRFYLRVAVVPTITTEIVRWVSVGGTNVARLALSTAGKLQLKTSGGTQIGSDSVALNLSQWYRVEMKNDATSATGVLEARLDGSQIAAGNNNVQGSWARVDLGAGVSTTCDIYFDDVAINDNSGLSQNSWAGPGSVIHLHPNAAGDSNSFSVQTGGTAGAANNYTRVSDVTPDNAATYNASVTLNQEDLFNCTDSGIGASDSVNVVSVAATVSNNTAADAVTAVTLELQKTAAGTKATSPAIIPNSTSWLTLAAASPFVYPITTYKDPDGGAWTQPNLDSMQVGYKLTAAGTNQARVTAIWALVDYTPAAAAGSPGAFFNIFH